MAEFWYKLVISGKKTIDQVPEKWREIVRKMIEDETGDSN